MSSARPPPAAVPSHFFPLRLQSYVSPHLPRCVSPADLQGGGRHAAFVLLARQLAFSCPVIPCVGGLPLAGVPAWPCTACPTTTGPGPVLCHSSLYRTERERGLAIHFAVPRTARRRASPSWGVGTCERVGGNDIPSAGW